MGTGRDGAGHRYEEFEMSADEQVRVTYIPHQDWAKGPTIRSQERAYAGRLSPGPEFPAHLAEDLVRAVRDVREP